MQHRYNDQVVLVRGKLESPALVVQSVMYGTEEHLTLVSLDPEKASPLLSGMNVDAAIRRDFVTPLTNGKTYGWKEAPEKSESMSQSEASSVLEQSTEIKVPVPEGDTNLLDPKVIAEEVKHGQEQNAAEQLDEAQGPVQPGDPESPHGIDTPADPQP